MKELMLLVIGGLLAVIVVQAMRWQNAPADAIAVDPKTQLPPVKQTAWSREYHQAVLRATANELDGIAELGLAKVERDEQFIDTVRKRLKWIDYDISAVLKIDYHVRYKYGLDLNKRLQMRYDDDKQILYVRTGNMELLSAEIIGNMKSKVLDTGWGIDEQMRLRELAEIMPVRVRKNAQQLLNDDSIKALVRENLEKIIRNVCEKLGEKPHDVQIELGASTAESEKIN